MRNDRRRSGARFALLAAGTLVLATWPGVTRAQFFGRGGIGAGSTPQGDILRGEGIAAMGFGQFNLATAMATSINTDTAIRWNEYVYLSIKE